jgi:hypothetical protein
MEWRPSTHDPIAPVRVVHLGKNWEVLNNDQSGGDPMVTPSTMRRQKKNGGGGGMRGGGGGTARPPSSHSMRTLPSRGGGSSLQPSPLRGKHNGRKEDLQDGAEDGVDEEEEEEEESKFGTATSFRTADSGRSRGGAGGSRMGLRDIWGTAMGSEELDPVKQQEVSSPRRFVSRDRALMRFLASSCSSTELLQTSKLR